MSGLVSMEMRDLQEKHRCSRKRRCWSSGSKSPGRAIHRWHFSEEQGVNSCVSPVVIPAGESTPALCCSPAMSRAPVRLQWALLEPFTMAVGWFKSHKSLRWTTVCTIIRLPKIWPAPCCSLWLVSLPANAAHCGWCRAAPRSTPEVGECQCWICIPADDRSLLLPLEMMLQYWSVTTSNRLRIYSPFLFWEEWMSKQYFRD